MNKTLLRFATLGLLATATALPAMSMAQTYRQHREQKKNEWKNIGIGAAAVGVYGLIKGDKNLAILGAAGAGYSAYRYSQDGKNDRYDRYGYNSSGYDRYGYNRSGYNRDGYNRDGYNRSGYNRDGYNRSGYGRDGYRHDDHDRDRDRYGRAQPYDRWNGRGPGNSDWGHSRGNKYGHSKH
jgi:hypothetical protein